MLSIIRCIYSFPFLFIFTLQNFFVITFQVLQLTQVIARISVRLLDNRERKRAGDSKADDGP